MGSVTTEAKPYGYWVHCEFQSGETRRFKSKGHSETKARRVPIFKRGFVRVVYLEPFTKEEWLRCFGEGRM